MVKSYQIQCLSFTFLEYSHLDSSTLRVHIFVDIFLAHVFIVFFKIINWKIFSKVTVVFTITTAMVSFPVRYQISVVNSKGY